ncbi:MAG: MFS transporter [Limnochordia bacterium]|jgi:MFS family permease|nr:MFS transporter [Bacillota bacterium]
MNKLPMYVAALMMDVVNGSFFLIAGLVAAAVTDNPILIGLSGTLHFGVKILLSVYFGHLSDQIGRKPLLVASCLILASAVMLLLLPGSLTVVYLSFMLAGVTAAMFWPVLGAWAGEGADGQELLDDLGKFNIAFSVGMTVGPFITGGLMGLSTLAAVAFTLIGILAIITFVLQVKEPPRQTKVEQPQVGTVPPFVLVGWIANFANFTAVGIVRILFPKMALELGISSFGIGTLFGLFYLAWLVTFVIMRVHSGWQYNPAPLYLLQGVGIGGFAILWQARSSVGLALGLVLFGICVAMTYYSSLFYCQDGQPDRGRKTGFHEFFLGSGMLIGPFVGGILAERFALQTPFAFCILVTVLAMIVEMGVLRQGKNLSHPG